MSSIDDLFQKVASGQPFGELQSFEQKLLLARASSAANLPDIEERKAGVRVAARIGGHDALNALGRYIADSDLEVRRSVFAFAVALQEPGQSVIRKMTDDTDPQLLVEVFEHLRHANDSAATGAGKKRLHHPDPDVRIAAIRYLSRVGGPSVLNELQALNDPDPKVREALSSLSAPTPSTPTKSTARSESAIASRLITAGQSGSPEATFTDQELQEGWHEFQKTHDPALLCAIANRATQASWTTRFRSLLQDKDPVIRKAAIGAIGRIGAGASLLAPLYACLRDADPQVRLATVEVLVGFSKKAELSRSIFDTLRALLNDPDTSVREAAKHAIEQK